MDITLDLPSELAIPLSVAGYDGEKLTSKAVTCGPALSA